MQNDFARQGESAVTQSVNQAVCHCMHPENPLSGNAPYFIILICLTPDDFTHQGGERWHSMDNGLKSIHDEKEHFSNLLFSEGWGYQRKI